MNDLWAALALLVIVAGSFYPFVFGGKTIQDSANFAASLYGSGSRPTPLVSMPATRVLDAGAPAWQTEPWFHLEHHLLVREHQFPLWNPYSAYGAPLLANMQSQPLSPLAWPVILDPDARGYSLWVVFRLYVGALLAFLYFRQFFGRPASCAGAVAFSFSGYFLLFVTMPELSVNVLIPAFLLAIERVCRRPGAGTAATLALALAITMFGGMPESETLLLTLAFIYWFARVLGDPQVRKSTLSILGFTAVGTALGIGLSAILLLPFLQYVLHSHNDHVASSPAFYTGVYHDEVLWSMLGSYLAPLLSGPPWNNVFNNFSGWSGDRSFFTSATAALALIGVFQAGLLRRDGGRNVPVFLFAACVALLFAKRFGLDVVNWVGALPVYRLVNFPKYEEAIIGFCVAALAAAGLQRLIDGRVRLEVVALSVGCILIILTKVSYELKPAYLALTANQSYYIESLLLAIVLLACFLIIAALMSLGIWRPKLAFAIVALIAAGPIAGFIVPLYYFVDENPPLAADPGLGDAYVRFLQRNADVNGRVYGQGNLLYPEWSDAFDLQDVRGLDALYPDRYLPFVRNFLQSDELVDRFTGAKAFDFQSVPLKHFVQLSAIHYLITSYTFGVLDVLAKAYPAGSIKVRPGSFIVGGVSRSGLFMHPSVEASKKVDVPLAVPQGARAFAVSLGMPDAVWHAPICGGGVRFALTLRRRDGGTIARISKYVDPKHRAEERHWFDYLLSLGASAGRMVLLSLNTAAGPTGTTCMDWAAWGDPRFVDAHGKTLDGLPGLRLVFRDPNTDVYAFSQPANRLRLFHRVIRSPDGPRSLAILAAPSFDPDSEAVVEGFPTSAAVVIGGGQPAENLSIERATALDVAASVTVPQASLLELADTDYPGWKATVDGAAVPIYRTNYLFRGIVVPPGSHRVRFSYRSIVVAIGAWVSVLSALAIAVLYSVSYLRINRREMGSQS